MLHCQALEAAIKPAMPNILTSPDSPYWKAVRQGAAPCFSNNNIKKVGITMAFASLNFFAESGLHISLLSAVGKGMQNATDVPLGWC